MQRKPLLGAFVTHAHPDHFNGLPYMVGEGVPVYANTDGAAMIAEIAILKGEQWQPGYGEEWPDRYRSPDHALSSGEASSWWGSGSRSAASGAAGSHADSYVLVWARLSLAVTSRWAESTVAPWARCAVVA
ncbi:hypothetical protein ACIBL3_46985 [Kribbella sp. NPDC050124]|uniref:hypothetical protein n=1 Tax=Kribbella sp. NPDC050124 TaxID=3364114 RepID=UPI0037915A1D